ncbi:MAG: response regulator transcription factor [Anaerolineales bacterium]|nr:response regulator transcription factor [Anaerolineales bacterium]
MMSGTLLVIEDDLDSCDLLQLILTRKGFQVEMAYDASTGLQKSSTLQPDGIILDLMLPDLDGWQACARLREMSDVPIIILTALDVAEYSIKGLELGADAYLVKPVAPEELVARVRAVLRRASRLRTRRGDGQGSLFTYKKLVVDFDRQEVTVAGQRVHLTPAEFRLLTVLVQHKGRLLPHQFLVRQVWGPEFSGGVDYLHRYINYLRRKLEKDPSQPELIHTEGEIGYRFA